MTVKNGAGRSLQDVAARFGRPALLLALVHLLAVYLFQIHGREYRLDFSSYYVWALAVREGMNPYDRSVMALAKQLGVDAMPSNYPPLFLMAFRPLTYLGLNAAFQVWLGLNIILLVASAVMITAPMRSFRVRLLLVAMVLLYGPTTDNLYWAQPQILMLFLIVVALEAARRGWSVGSSAALATAILLKLFPAVVLGYFVMARQWQIVRGTVIGVLIGSVLGLWALGPALNVALVRQLLASSGERFLQYALNISIGAAIYRAFWLVGLDGSGASDHVRVLITVLAMLAIVLLCISGSMQANRRGESAKALGLWVTASVLLTPVNWFHHMVLLLLPLIEITGSAAIGSMSFKLAATSYGFAEVALLLLWARWLSWPHDNLPLQIAIAASAFISMLVCLAASYDFAGDVTGRSPRCGKGRPGAIVRV